MSTALASETDRERTHLAMFSLHDLSYALLTCRWYRMVVVARQVTVVRPARSTGEGLNGGKEAVVNVCSGPEAPSSLAQRPLRKRIASPESLRGSPRAYDHRRRPVPRPNDQGRMEATRSRECPVPRHLSGFSLRVAPALASQPTQARRPVRDR